MTALEPALPDGHGLATDKLVLATTDLELAVKPVRLGIGEACTVPTYIGKAELAIYGNVETCLAPPNSPKPPAWTYPAP